MNERMLELAKEAEWLANRGDHVDVKVMMQKFAELIVRECCKYLNNEAERLYGLKHDDSGLLAEKCYDNIQGIKEHFGVNK